MDSGLGSDEDRKGRTKEQKQLRNQQLLSGCFIDAASLSDDAEVAVERRSDERRQGALIFKSSIPQFSMLQMSASSEPAAEAPQSYPESTSTPYNSIVHLDDEGDAGARKTPLGFYVDLNEMPEPPPKAASTDAKKNIFSMVIDFEGPKKDKPMKLSSSLISYKKNKQTKQLTLTTKYNNGNSSLSSSVSSISSVAGPSSSRPSDDLGHLSDNAPPSASPPRSSSSSENISLENPTILHQNTAEQAPLIPLKDKEDDDNNNNNNGQVK